MNTQIPLGLAFAFAAFTGLFQSHSYAQRSGVCNAQGTTALALTEYAGVPASDDSDVADINNDGMPDLILAHGNGYSIFTGIRVYLGDGTREAFGEAEQDYERTIGSISQVAVADINSDGDLDLVYASTTAIGVLIGDGSGNFSEPTTIGISTFHGYPVGELAIGDTDADGDTDILAYSVDDIFHIRNTTDRGSDVVRLLSPSIVSLTRWGMDMNVEDLNGDGRTDFVISHSYSQAITIGLSGNCTDFCLSTLELPVSDGVLELADFDRDGDPDIAVAGSPVMFSGSDSLWIGKNNGVDGQGALVLDTTSPLIDLGVRGAPRFLTSGIVNTDVKSDLVFRSSPPSGNQIKVLLNTSNSSGIGFRPLTSVTIPPNSWIEFTTADLDGDGLAETIVTTNYIANGESLPILWNDSVPACRLR